jgi:hypothetical protein
MRNVSPDNLIYIIANHKISYHLVIGLGFMLGLRKEPWTVWFTKLSLEHLFRLSISTVLLLIYNISDKKVR